MEHIDMLALAGSAICLLFAALYYALTVWRDNRPRKPDAALHWTPRSDDDINNDSDKPVQEPTPTE